MTPIGPLESLNFARSCEILCPVRPMRLFVLIVLFEGVSP